MTTWLLPALLAGLTGAVPVLLRRRQTQSVPATVPTEANRRRSPGPGEAR